MGDNPSQHEQADATFAERFGELFSAKAYSIAAMGILLAWMWMGLTEGFPVFMDGAVDTPSVVIMLFSIAASLLSFGFLRRLDRFLARPIVWVGAAACVTAACIMLLCLFGGLIPAGGLVRVAAVRCLMVPIGLGSGLLIHCCAADFACLRPASAAVGFFVACSVMFTVYFSLDVCKDVGGQSIEGGLFCLLPLAAALLLTRSRKAIVERLALWPQEGCSFAKGYRQMCTSFGVFFFAMAAKAAIEPAHEFAVASDTSVVAILLLSLLLFYLIAIKARPLGVFKLIKNTYSVAIVVLTVSIAMAPLSLDPVMSIVFNADCIALVMVLWLLVVFVSNANEAYVCKVVSIALAAATVGMAVGWAAGATIQAVLGHERIYASIGIACATAVFSTVGFSSKNFPYLTTHGEAAKRMQRIKEASALLQVDFDGLLAQKTGLSKRECEVLALLVEGHSAATIASKLTISYYTARTHVRNIYQKLDVHSHAELLEVRERFREETLAQLAE